MLGKNFVWKLSGKATKNSKIQCSSKCQISKVKKLRVQYTRYISSNVLENSQISIIQFSEILYKPAIWVYH